MYAVFPSESALLGRIVECVAISRDFCPSLKCFSQFWNLMATLAYFDHDQGG